MQGQLRIFHSWREVLPGQKACRGMRTAVSWRFMVNPWRQHSMPVLVVSPFVLWVWLFLFADVMVINVIGWFAAQDLNDASWIQYPLILLGFTVWFIADDLRHHWIEGVAHALHFEDVVDGVCPDRESEINEAAVWRWYVKQGKPWRINPKRERQDVRFVDASERMEVYQRAMEEEARRLRKNHRV